MRIFKYILFAAAAAVVVFFGGRYLTHTENYTGNVLGGSQVIVYAEPVRIKIPAINVDAKVIPVGINAKGEMDTPKNQYDVAWYKNGPHPGMQGSAVMAGHLDTKLTPEAVFYNLNKLKPGDEIEITDKDGAVIKFKVKESKEYPYDAKADEIFDPNTSPRLNLITCAGEWLKDKKVYTKRLIVFAEKV